MDLGRDLDLVVELINTEWVLASPPDRLTSVEVFRDILRRAGDKETARQLRKRDLEALRELRSDLHAAFAMPAPADAAAYVSDLMVAAGIVARLEVSDAGSVHLEWAGDRRGVAALRARFVGALTEQLLRSATARIGVCQAPPCTCVYVDRGRAGTRRYCCDLCNDRAAASAYRSRRRQKP